MKKPDSNCGPAARVPLSGRTPGKCSSAVNLASSLPLVVVLGLIALSACNPVKDLRDRERMTKLDTVVNTYRKLMRWGDYDQAARYIKARDESHTQPDFKDMERFKISSFTVVDQLVADTESDAKVTAYIEFYDIDSGVASSVRDDQFWWYHEEEKRWYLGSPMIQFSQYAK